MTRTITPRLSHVSIEPWEDACGNTGIAVHPVWFDVDRPDTGGWVVSNRSVARRLKAAIEDGNALANVHVATDVRGETYVAYNSRVMGRYMNADLRRLGY